MLTDDTKITLSIRQLKRIIAIFDTVAHRKCDQKMFSEGLTDYIYDNILVNEMSIEKAVYERRLFYRGAQLVGNWCLCKWCQLYSPDNMNFAHWSGELSGLLTTIRSWTINNGIDRRKSAERVLTKKCDYDKESKILSIVKDKFGVEGIKDEEQRITVATEFVKGLNKFIDVISDNSITIESYMASTFNSPTKEQ